MEKRAITQFRSVQGVGLLATNNFTLVTAKYVQGGYLVFEIEEPGRFVFVALRMSDFAFVTSKAAQTHSEAWRALMEELDRREA